MKSWLYRFLGLSIAWASPQPYVLYYGDPTPLWPKLSQFDYAILEPEHPGLTLPPQSKTRWIAYLSLGEIHQSRPYYQELESELLPENPHWPKAFRVDPRSPKWRHFLLDTLIPQLRSAGWQGLFFDTVDNGPWLESQDSSAFAGAGQAMFDLIVEIRKSWPEGFLVLNNGYELQPQIAPYVDRILLEGLNTRYYFDQKKYGPSDPSERSMRIARARASLAMSPHTPIWILDYAAHSRDPLARKAHQMQNKLAWQGIVTELSLQSWKSF